MNTRRLASIGSATVVAAMLAIPQSNADEGGRGHFPGPHGDHGLVGAWLMDVMPYNCATGDSMPAGAFEALITFHADGTLSAWFQNATITTTRSPGHGAWKRKRGRNDYEISFLHLRYNLQTGAFLGRQFAEGDLELDRDGDSFTVNSKATIFDASGAPSGQGCSTMVSSRIRP
jgi:hypothetical protein